jgi:hypothetical protein
MATPDCFFPLLLGILTQEQDDADSFRRRLIGEERRKRDRRLPRQTLVSPYRSPWEMVYKSANDQGIITLCGFDSKSFRDLHEGFKCYYKRFSPYSDDGLCVGCM